MHLVHSYQQHALYTDFVDERDCLNMASTSVSCVQFIYTAKMTNNGLYLFSFKEYGM